MKSTTLSALIAFSIHPVISDESSGGGPMSSVVEDEAKDEEKDGTMVELTGRVIDVRDVVLATSLSIRKVPIAAWK